MGQILKIKSIPDISSLVKATDFNNIVTEIEGRIPSINITGLATNSELNAVENKIPDVSSFVKKTEFNTKVTEIEGKIPDVSSLVKTTDFDPKLKQISDRVTKNKSKHLLVENELKKLKTFDLSYFKGENYFGDNNVNYLVFEVSLKYLNFYDDSFHKPLLSWNSKGVSKGVIKVPRPRSPTTENTLPYQKIKLKFNGSCLIQDQIIYTPQTTVNIYIVYEITKNNYISDYPALENCLFGSVKLTKNRDIDKYKYSGYGIGFDRKGEFLFDNGFGQNVITFGADMSSSVHVSNKTKNILVLGKDFTQGLDRIAIYAEKVYSINFTKTNTKFCLSLHYNLSNKYLFVNGTEINKFKTKDSEIIAAPICLGNISREFQ